MYVIVSKHVAHFVVFGLFQKLDAFPLKKTWESEKKLPTFSLGIPQNLFTFSVPRV